METSPAARPQHPGHITLARSLLACLLLLLLPLKAACESGGLLTWERDQGELTASFTDGILTLRPLSPDAVQVRFEETKGASIEDQVIVSTAPCPFTVEDQADGLRLKIEGMSVWLDKATGQLRFFDHQGKVILVETPHGRRLRKSSVQGTPCLAVESCFESPEGEYLLGSGQFQDGQLNLRDLPRRLTQVNTQIALPMFLSDRGYGLLWVNHGLTDLNPAEQSVTLTRQSDAAAATKVVVTTSEGSREESRRTAVFCGEWHCEKAGLQAFLLDVGNKMARRWDLEIDGRTVVRCSNLWLPPTTSGHVQLDEGTHSIRVLAEKEDAPTLFVRPAAPQTVYRSPVSKGINYVVFAGSPEEIVASYRRVTGPAPMMPLWALGYIHCRERFTSQSQLLSTAEEFRRRALPMDVIVQDWQYWGHHGWNAMRFDEGAYPNPKAMVTSLHAMKARLMVSVWSRIDEQSELGARFKERGYFLPGTQWVDFFNPAAASFYWENFSRLLVPIGIDAWWLDATEPENDDLSGRCTHAGPGETVRNLYPLMVTQTVYHGLRKDAPEQRVFILTRSAFPGQQRYATATWSGDIGNDWDTLRRQIPAGLNQMAAGIPWWTTDAGGFFRPGTGQYESPDYHERFLRWLQFATFCPLMRVHGYQTDTEFWRYGSEVEAKARELLALRYRLLPYLYSQAWRVSAHGSTLMRPLMMDFLQDKKALEISDQYMFGPAFLVSPVLHAGARSRELYLPRNGKGWFDFWTGRQLKDGQSTLVEAPLSQIPLHVPAGSIIPLGRPVQHTGEAETDLEIRVYPGASGSFEFYSDDGRSYDYEKGLHRLIRMDWDDAHSTLRISDEAGAYPDMPRELNFRLVKVGVGHGVGTENTPEPDALVTYSGRATTIILP
jgi:alpha-D-xyloside xylohydrolase